MAGVTWLFRRLRAMNLQEILWRLSQKCMQEVEKKHFFGKKVSVVSQLFFLKPDIGDINPKRMGLALQHERDNVSRVISLLGEYDYDRYCKDWNAGFQTESRWPLEWSYCLHYKQRDDIGDARTNWELNRHFQFALLAKDYAVTGEQKYLDELLELFGSWERENPFLWGISWTSTMEMAIRTSNWCYTHAFLAATPDAPRQLLSALQTGIINMTEYIVRHYSRYSSANNHLIVEAYAIGQSGILLQYQPWIDLSIKILTRELPRQNYTDGVNREQSLHYQVFYMEAMGLMWRLLKKNDIPIPASWPRMVRNMCRYLVACRGDYGELIKFGDDDSGKILDLSGTLDYIQYVLELFSCLLDERYVNLDGCTENILYLFTEAERAEAMCKPLYKVRESCCFQKGGNSILRSQDGRVLIGIDHAPLGFGSIAAHGHADALSFQLFLDGIPIFADPGSYIYHCDLLRRNADRCTMNHNTVCLNKQDQSEMQGPFLWGKKAICTLTEVGLSNRGDVIEAIHNGYAPIQVKRRFEFDRKRTLVITDTVRGQGDAVASFVLGPMVKVIAIQGAEVWLRVPRNDIRLVVEGRNVRFQWGQRNQAIALNYGVNQLSTALTLHFTCANSTQLITKISISACQSNKKVHTT